MNDYKNIIKNNGSHQNRIGYLGINGSYSSIVTKKIFNMNEDFQEFKTFEGIITAVKNDTLSFGVVPIENSSTGSILEVFDLIKTSDLKIVGERCLTIRHNLITKNNIKLEAINQVYSHSQALKQCKRIIQEYNWEAIEVSSTAEAVKLVNRKPRNDIAAIGSKRAAAIYNLSILKKDINYNSKNITRFIVLSKNYLLNEPKDKITIGFSVKHTAGSLFEALKHFRDLKVNLYKIESRPIIEKPFEYYFYLDFEGNLNSKIIKKLLKLIKKDTTSIKIFGNYKNHSWIE